MTAMSLAMSSDSIAKKKLRKTVAASSLSTPRSSGPLARVSLPRRSRHFDRALCGVGGEGAGGVGEGFLVWCVWHRS